MQGPDRQEVSVRGTCSIDGCTRLRQGRGLCPTHYRRLRIYGDPLVTQRIYGGDGVERFWSKVEKSDGCWLWSGYVNDKGYGTLQLEGKMRRAHVFAFELANGPVPSRHGS
jgi:hypothetical protein